MNRERCKNRNHNDQRLRGGRHYECRTCGEVFPCRGSCPHLDCIVATGRELPDSVGHGAREAIAAELALLYPDHRFTIDPDRSFGIPSAFDFQLEAADRNTQRTYDEEAE